MAARVIGTPWTREASPITDEVVASLDAYWRLANYLSVGQIYLKDNPLLTRPLTFSDMKERPIGHWGTVPGLNFIYAHVNRLVQTRRQSTIVVVGPGHGGSAGAVSSLVDGTYRERHPEVGDDAAGLAEFMRAYSAPRGMPSNMTPVIPGSIHTGGELGYALTHAFGAVLDNPDLLAIAIIGDGEAEEAATAGAWQIDKLVNPSNDGIVLPIVHMNGYKITTPSILAAISPEERDAYFIGLGYRPHTFRAGFDDEPAASFHRRFAELVDEVFDEICTIKARAAAGDASRPAYPLIVLQTPKGWTTPVTPDGVELENSTRTHEVPIRVGHSKARLEFIESWLRSYHPEELFDATGAIKPCVRGCMPTGELRLGAQPAADGGVVRHPLELPDARRYEVSVAPEERGAHVAGLAGAFGAFTRDIIPTNRGSFRIFSPDELSSNRMQAALDVTSKQWNADEADLPLASTRAMHLAPTGGVLELLSEHQMEGLLEGYVLTGRHGVWTTYEAFAMLVASMVGQHCKWLEETGRFASWRAPISSLNILLTSHVWRQDHNGFSHQDPGFADVILNKGAAGEHVANLYYPADANMALAVAERVYASTDCVNAVVAGKQESPVYLTLDEARFELEHGAAVWSWASTAAGAPEVVIASVGDSATVEAVEAARILARAGVRLQFVNVVDLRCLEDPRHNDRALDEDAFAALFPPDVPVTFAFHGYPGTLKRILFDRVSSARIEVHGFVDEGSTTTPFGMLYDNGMDRFALAASALAQIDEEGHRPLIAELHERRDACMAYAVEHGVDDPELHL